LQLLFGSFRKDKFASDGGPVELSVASVVLVTQVQLVRAGIK